MQSTKLIIKILNELTDRVEWVHLSYIDRELYKKFLDAKGIDTTEMNDVLSRWVKEDFNFETTMTTTRDIIILKQLVKDFYRSAHPELYIESPTDRQGWLRVWLTRKMKEELRIYGKEYF